MEKFVMAAGSAVRYSEFGKGKKTICLLHGYLESIEVFENFAGQLGKNHHIILIDLPGHGISNHGNRETITVEYMAQVVAVILNKAGVSHCTVLGHSMGGYVAIALTEIHPELVEALILFHSTPSGDSLEKRELRQREIAAIEAGKKELLATINPGRGFAKDNLKRCADAIDELSEQIMITEDKAIIATLKGLMERPDRNDFFEKLTIPHLMIFGLKDNYIPVEIAEELISKNPNAQIAWLENSGHHGFIEEPEKSYEIINQFVNSL